ncbi:MAG: hypothetical protein WKF71_07825 [Pyrinomonadaceae bacterium]
MSETLAESQRIMQERISQNPALAEWWKGKKGDGFGLNEQTIARVREFGSQLGEEIVVSGRDGREGRAERRTRVGRSEERGELPHVSRWTTRALRERV